MIFALAAGSTLFQAAGSFASASAAKNEANRQAALEMDKTHEEARRMQRESQQTQALTRAIMGASGTTGEGSQDFYLKDMQAEQTRQLQWLRKVGASNAESIRRQGNALAQQYTAQGVNQLFQAGFNAFGGGK